MRMNAIPIEEKRERSRERRMGGDRASDCLTIEFTQSQAASELQSRDPNSAVLPQRRPVHFCWRPLGMAPIELGFAALY